MNLPRFARTATFRLSVTFSAACVVSGLLLFTVIYQQTKAFETARSAAFMAMEARTVLNAPEDRIVWTVTNRFSNEYRDMTFAALFAADGHLIAGDLEHVPPGLAADGRPHAVDVVRPDGHGQQGVVAMAFQLPNGRLLVLGRVVSVLTQLEEIVARALILGIIPAVGLALSAGIWLSRSAARRVKAVNQSIERIMQGNIHERLPMLGIDDEFDQLANSVNRMLAQIERLLGEVQAVGDNIAHDLRTPLARVRTLLERGRNKARTKEHLDEVTERAIAGLDQALTVITALLRIGEIEGGQRKSAFGDVDLNEIIREVGDLYAPIAETKQIDFNVEAEATTSVHGDRDLLIEAIANLLDNAIKFVPHGGLVRLTVTDSEQGPVIRVSNTGPGIPPEERAAVMKRFYRLDKSRHIGGSGLGLSIVLAIATLHDFDIGISDARPGCTFELRCYAPKRALTDPLRAPMVRRLKLPWSRPAGDFGTRPIQERYEPG